MNTDNSEYNTLIPELIERIEYFSKLIHEYYDEYMDFACENDISGKSDMELKRIYKELNSVNKSLTKIHNQYLKNSKFVDYRTWLQESWLENNSGEDY
jgi:hypothetical protein